MIYDFHFAPVFARIGLLYSGLERTLWISVAVVMLGFLLGTCGAFLLRWRSRWLRRLVRGYVEIIRGTPLIAQLFFVYFGLPGLGLRFDALNAGILSMTVYLGAYATEIVRGGLDAVPRGQSDAGAALGLSRFQIFLFIILKPALKAMFPAVASQVTLIMLATSVLSQIGIEELFQAAGRIDSDTYRSFESYTVVCGFYLAIALLSRAGFAALYWLLFAQREPRGRVIMVS